MNFVYDLTNRPASFDFVMWLAAAATHAQGPFDVSILKGPKNGFRDDNLEPQDLNARRALLENVMLPATRLYDVRRLDVFPESAEGHQHTCVAAALYQDKPVVSLEVPEWAMQVVRNWYPVPPVVVCMRGSAYHRCRNSNNLEWARAIEALRDRGHEVVVVNEFGREKQFHNLILRAALHEHALCTLGVNGGPMNLSYLNDKASYCLFKPVADTTATTEEWWATRIGAPKGYDFPWALPHQRIIWEEDTCDVILKAFDDRQEKTGTTFPVPKPLAPPRFIPGLNTPVDTMLEQARGNLKRDLPMFMGHVPHVGKALIVGGGPSLKETLPDLRRHQARGAHVFALNGTHDWLIDRGVIPDFMVMLDARKENARFVQKPHKAVTYLVAAQCHPDVFEALDGYEVTMWAAWAPGMNELAQEFNDRPICVVGGGNTVGLKAMCLAYLWGYQSMHMFGFDSSYRDGENHVYKQSLNDGEAVMDITAEGKTFKCARWMAKQAIDFQNQLAELTERGVSVKVHGDGLIPWVTRNWILKQTKHTSPSSPGKRRTTQAASLAST